MDSANDYIIIGAGIVGLATAISLRKNNQNSTILILEKESELGVHQTGHNSGVIHSGIYYRPGSKKAINCRKGYNLLLRYCDDNEINYDLCGKLIVATSKDQLSTLEQIFNRGIENGLKNLKLLNRTEFLEIEPYVKGIKAIQVPETGIIDFGIVLKKYSETLLKKEGKIFFDEEVINLKESSDSVTVITKKSSYESKYVISCAGLQSDRIALKTEKQLDLRIIPFRGEYFEVVEGRRNIIRNLVYPVPDPSFPFLGVHFTRKINNGIEAGPNAVFAFSREGYRNFNFDIKDTYDAISWPGFRKVIKRYWRTGFGEFYRSYSKKAFTKALNNLVPEIRKEDLVKGGVGIRAQACDIKGNLINDFYFKKSKRILHVLNAPSPAATASLAIGEQITDMIMN